jgi:chromosome partitioning protein
MIIVGGGIKGGSGKTTLATNLAVMRAAAGREVVLIDADEQETSYDFTQLRAERFDGQPGYLCTKLSGMGVRTVALQFAQKYQDIIIDTGGRDTGSQRAALSVADVLLVPFIPRSFDVWTLEKVTQLLAEVKPNNPKLKAYTFLNRADSRGQFPALSAAALKDSDPELLQFSGLALGSRVAFGTAAAEGLAVTEIKPLDTKAVEEMTELYNYVFDSTNTAKYSDINMTSAGAQ